MTRVDDQPIPDLDPHPIAPGAPLARWPWRPVIGLEQLPQAAYVWDDVDDAIVWDASTVVEHGYLNAAAGQATTPDTPADYMTGSWRFRCKVRMATVAETSGHIAMHRATGASNLAWDFYALGGSTGSRFRISSNGTSFAFSGNVHPEGTIPVGTDVWLEARWEAVGPYTAGAVSHDGETWTDLTHTLRAAMTMFNSTAPITVGGLVSGAARFQGRIYWAEVETLDDVGTPTGLVWRFDADEYPGTGASFVDPRGRTWTLTSDTVITPAVHGEPPYVWDAPFVGGGFTDAACDFMALDIDPGEPDDLYVFPAVAATLTLANADGAYTPWSADGRLVYWAPGRRLAAYWLNVATGEERWMFAGRVASWTLNADGTVTVVAFDGLSSLAQAIGPWTPGAMGDTPRARVLAVAEAAGYLDPIAAAVGNVTLSTEETSNAPLEMIEVAALSDGGLFYSDADGTLVYRDRLWRAGRDDQPRVWAVSDNVCTAGVIVWAAAMAADDERLTNYVRLVNAAEPPLIAVASLSESMWAGDARFVLTHPDPDQWQTQVQGDDLAAYLLAQQSTPSMAVEAFDLYGLDPRQPDVADFASGLRRGDLVEVIHAFIDASGRPAELDLSAIVLGVAHNLTPDEWRSTVQLSRTVDHRIVEVWDQTIYVWDEDNPANVWRY